MSNYAIFFDYKGRTYRLPVNPEQIEVSSSMATQKYEVLKYGQIIIPTHMELKQYSFECEIPLDVSNYVEMKRYSSEAEVKKEDIEPYIDLFQKWRSELAPVQFLAGSVNAKGDNVEPDSINEKVIIDDLKITEKAGEEGDKYVSFKLIQYKDFSKIEQTLEVDEKTGKKRKKEQNKFNPKSTGYYIVVSGDTLWAIAKKYYGKGSEYIKIYNANKDKIKNPSLIYPGQKLVIPS